ncbi:MAG: hypothetical protein J7M17_02215 [Anaerolineae bacterium]|nr:hypothetical protein [Anaerolineae bacterium]
MKTNASFPNRHDGLLLGAWLVAVIGVFGPWVGQPAAALAWNACDLSEILRQLPQIQTCAITVNLQALRLPQVGLAVLLPLLLAQARPQWRWGAALLGAGLALGVLPPYPQIIEAWRAPGWRVPFWWATGAALAAGILAGCGPRLGAWRPWLILAWTVLTGVPAGVTFYRLLPAIRELYAAPVHPGWGFWSCAGGLLTLAGLSWQQALKKMTNDSAEKTN